MGQWLSVCAHACTCVCAPVCVHMCVRVCVHMHLCVCVFVSVCICLGPCRSGVYRRTFSGCWDWEGKRPNQGMSLDFWGYRSLNN